MDGTAVRCREYRFSEVALLLVLFVASRVAAFAVGLRFSTDTLARLYHLLDLEILHRHLGRGLLNLHAQPPLYNAIVGITEKVGGNVWGPLLLGLQILLGLVAILCVYGTLVRLRVDSFLRVPACILLILNPAAIAYEFDPFYTQFVYALLAILMYLTILFIQTRSKHSLALVIFTCLCLTLLRASFQWIWLASVMAVLWWNLPRSRRLIAAFGTMGLLLSLLWPAKNYVMFHQFSSSTWLPFSMAKHWRGIRDTPKYRAWIDQGLIPTMSIPIENGDMTVAELRAKFPVKQTGDPELDDLRKKTGGDVNWDSLPMLQMHKTQAKDVTFLLRHAPLAYVKSVASAVGLYFEPTAEYFTLHENKAKYSLIAPYENIFRRICCNVLAPDARADDDIKTPVHRSLKQNLDRICVVALLAYGVLVALFLSLWSASFWGSESDRRAFSGVMLLTPAYIFALVSLVEVGENMRFRFETEAIVTVLVLLSVQQYLDRHSNLLRARTFTDAGLEPARNLATG